LTQHPAWVYTLLGAGINLTIMSVEQKLENERDQQLRQACVDLATRVVGKPIYMVDGSKQHDDVVEVAKKIYKFVANKNE
jgi:hypothetical protein